MGTIGRKEKDLMDHLESIIHHYIFTQDLPAQDICRKPEMKIIEILGRNGPMKMTEIADQALLSLSTVTGIMDSLVAKSLVQRDRSDEDRRIVKVDLTDEGRTLYLEMVEVRLRMVRGMLGSLNSKEQDLLIQLFEKMVERIEREKKQATL